VAYDFYLFSSMRRFAAAVGEETAETRALSLEQVFCLRSFRAVPGSAPLQLTLRAIVALCFEGNVVIPDGTAGGALHSQVLVYSSAAVYPGVIGFTPFLDNVRCMTRAACNVLRRRLKRKERERVC